MKEIKAVLFDVFGTVVDWRKSIANEALNIGKKYNIEANWGQFADEWREAYHDQMKAVNSGERKWINVDQIHFERLEFLLQKYNFPKINYEEKLKLNKAWHRLSPWSDSVIGLKRLKTKYIIAPLSNGNISLLTNMGKHANLPWDAILSAEISKKYKPDIQVYQDAARILGNDLEETLMVAAHKFDLLGALEAGLRVAMVTRPDEFGDNKKADTENDKRWEFYCRDFNQLADELNCD